MTTGNGCIARIFGKTKSPLDTSCFCSAIETGNPRNLRIRNRTNFNRMIWSEKFKSGINRTDFIRFFWSLNGNLYRPLFCESIRKETPERAPREKKYREKKSKRFHISKLLNECSTHTHLVFFYIGLIKWVHSHHIPQENNFQHFCLKKISDISRRRFKFIRDIRTTLTEPCLSISNIRGMHNLG